MNLNLTKTMKNFLKLFIMESINKNLEGVYRYNSDLHRGEGLFYSDTVTKKKNFKWSMNVLYIYVRKSKLS